MQVSLDGFNSTGQNDEQKWVTWDLGWIKQYVINLHDLTDTIIIGRKLAVDYIPFWQETVKNPNHPMFELAKRIVKAKKVVFTKTLDKSIWDNTELAKGNLKEEIEIRASTIWANEFIKQRLKKRIPAVDSIHINDHLWLLSQARLPNDKLYHLTRTTAY